MNQRSRECEEGAIKRFGLRREAQRHAALAAGANIRKAVSPLRSATAVQKNEH
jgi:hypothetical protein